MTRPCPEKSEGDHITSCSRESGRGPGPGMAGATAAWLWEADSGLGEGSPCWRSRTLPPGLHAVPSAGAVRSPGSHPGAPACVGETQPCLEGPHGSAPPSGAAEDAVRGHAGHGEEGVWGRPRQGRAVRDREGSVPRPGPLGRDQGPTEDGCDSGAQSTWYRAWRRVGEGWESPRAVSRGARRALQPAPRRPPMPLPPPTRMTSPWLGTRSTSHPARRPPP